MTAAELLDDSVASSVTLDARVVALRWDVVPWSLIFDLDVPESEADGAPMRRAWLLFLGLSRVDIPVTGRLPLGIWLTSSVFQREGNDGLREYRIGALLPQFEGDQLMDDPHREVLLVARTMAAARSRRGLHSSTEGLRFAQRLELADDMAMLGALAPVLEPFSESGITGGD